MSEWADRERRLSSESSAEAGQWVTARAEFQREIMDAFSDPKVEEVVGMTSTQVGKSEILNNVIGYHIDQDPCPILLLEPSDKFAEDYSKNRIAPMFRDTPCLQKKFKDIKTRDSDNTILQKSFVGGYLAIAGANAPTSVAGRPIRLLLCDEIERYPLSAGTEGSPIALARKRTSNFFNAKIGYFSTPLRKGGPIHELYESSDKRQHWVPCPHCNHKQILVWENIKWDEGKPETARYECVECKQEIEESEKSWMILNGEWMPSAPFTGRAGFNINEISSPWVRWKKMVKDFLEIKDNPEKEKTFVNTSLGQPYELTGEAPKWKELYDRKENYPMRIVPAQASLLVGSVDVQKDRLEVLVLAFARDKQNWVIEHRLIMGDTARQETWDKLTEFYREEYPHARSGVLMPLRMLAVDSGYLATTVYNWCRRFPSSRVMAVKGRDTLPTIIGKPNQQDVTVQGKRLSKGLQVWPVGVSKAKEDLYTWLRLEKPLDGEEYPSCFCHFPEFGDEFFKQLVAEEQVKKMVDGYPTYEWVNKYGRNEVLDLWVYSRAAAAAVGLDRMTSKHWDVLEAQVGTTFKRLDKNVEGSEKSPASSSPPPPEPAKTPARRSSYWGNR